MSDNPPQIKTIAGRYALTQEVREGGMSVVQKAFDVKEQRFCAIKRMKTSADEIRNKESFNREYKALSDLVEHPNIVSIYEAGTDDDGFYMVLEWIPENLEQWITKNGEMSWFEFYNRIGRPILDALSFSQGHNWSHRDVKPSNILITEEGVAKIADYGIAKNLDQPVLGLTFNRFRSAPFTPPEDDDREEWRCSRDCFSVAALAVYCLTGKLPSDYGELAALTSALDAETMPAALIQNALSHTPQERPPLASAFLAELDDYENQRRAGLRQSLNCYLQIGAQCLHRLMQDLDIADRQEVERYLLDELHDAAVGFSTYQASDGTTGLRISAVTWTFDTFPAPNRAGRLVILRAWQSRSSEVERRREASFRPPIIFSFGYPATPDISAAELEKLLLDTAGFEAEERDHAIALQRERCFRVWYAFLQAKADFEARRENAIGYVDSRINEDRAAFRTELPAPLEIIGQSRLVRPPAGGYIFCDVVDVNLDEVLVRVSSGDPTGLPRRGLLELNTVAAERAIERQRAALDAVNYNRAAAVSLRPVVVDPSVARLPVAVPRLIVEGGAFDEEKHAILQQALGVQDILAITGPPGTGKTRLIEEILVQYLKRYPRHRILISSQTNVALDNVIVRVRERQPTIDIVRIGRMDDAKIDPACRDLVLERKAALWAKEVARKAEAHMIQWAQNRGIDHANIVLGMCVAALIRLLEQLALIESQLRGANERARAVDERAERKLTDTGSADSDEIRTDAVEAQAAVGELGTAAARLRAEIQEVRNRLRDSGGDGADLAALTGPNDLRDWSEMLLGSTEDERLCRELLQLQEDWLLRVGRSSDFHAAMLASARIVAGTCVGMAGVRGMAQVAYDLCIVDEASRATATEILIPMSRSRKWILVGDPKQLPPFFEDDSVTHLDDFADEEVRQTLFDRFLLALPADAVTSLKRQHRMVKPIGDLISYVFYDGQLESPKVRPDVTLPGAFPKPVTWLSTSSLPDRTEARRGPSFRNDCECRTIAGALTSIDFIARRRKATYDVAVIAGYVAQVKALQDQIRDYLHEWTGLNVTCSTVDAFQGNEAEICIYSVTRSNPEGRLGFLKEKPRLNVALSRGRSSLIIVGDDAFCREATGENPFRKLLEFIDANPAGCERRAA